MRRDQLEYAIRTACQIIGRPEVIIVGSQSILGTFREDPLPADTTMSVEIDILPISDDNAETERLADLNEGVAGEFSPFEELHGFGIDGVDLKHVRPADRLAREARQSPERQHRGTGRRAPVHRLVPRQRGLVRS